MFKKNSLKPPAPRQVRIGRAWEQANYWIMCLPAILWLVFFHLYPMLGNWIAFVDYTPKKGIFSCRPAFV